MRVPKILEQKIILTILEILQFFVLLQLHPGLSRQKSGCNWKSTQKYCISETVSTISGFGIFLDMYECLKSYLEKMV